MDRTFPLIPILLATLLLASCESTGPKVSGQAPEEPVPVVSGQVTEEPAPVVSGQAAEEPAPVETERPETEPAVSAVTKRKAVERKKTKKKARAKRKIVLSKSGGGLGIPSLKRPVYRAAQEGEPLSAEDQPPSVVSKELGFTEEEPTPASESRSPEEAALMAPQPVMAAMENGGEEPASVSSPLERLDKYNVSLAAKDHYAIPSSGDNKMTVWIGHEDYTPDYSDRENIAVKVKELLDTKAGDTALITPIVNRSYFDVLDSDYKLLDVDKAECLQVTKDGSSVVFFLKPKKAGTTDLQAKVNLYSSNDCSGPTKTKYSQIIGVTVTINRIENIKEKAKPRLYELLEIAWDKFKEFWAWLLGIIVLVASVFIGRWIKKKTGIRVNNIGGE